MDMGEKRDKAGMSAVEAAFDRIIAECITRLEHLKHNVAVAIANKNRLNATITDVRIEITQWEQRAAQAESNGNISLAQEARKQVHALSRILAPYELELRGKAADVEQAKHNIGVLYARLEDAKLARMCVKNGGNGVPDLVWMNAVACFFEALANANESPGDDAI